MSMFKQAYRDNSHDRKDRRTMEITFEDVTLLYQRTAEPGAGIVSMEEGFDISSHEEEIKAANWLHCTFGGDVLLLKERNEMNVKTPDIKWRGASWELKTPIAATENAFSQNVQSALRQIISDPGGIIINLNKCGAQIEEAELAICARIRRSAKVNADVIIIQKDEQYKILRFKRIEDKKIMPQPTG